MSVEINQVIETATKRAQAMVEGDIETLDQLLAEDFSYVNSMGQRYDKKGYLAMIASPGDMLWKAQSFEDIKVQCYDAIAILYGVIRDQFSVKGVDYDARFSTLQVYIKRNDIWLWLTGQTTELV